MHVEDTKGEIIKNPSQGVGLGEQAIGTILCVRDDSKETSRLRRKGVMFESLDFEMEDI